MSFVTQLNLGYPPAGSIVYNAYWQEHCTVVNHNENGSVTVWWHGDAKFVTQQVPRETTHRTSFQPTRGRTGDRIVWVEDADV
jgi:hypothetical protein